MAEPSEDPSAPSESSWYTSPEEKPDTPLAKAVSYTACVALFAVVFGLGALFLPYILAYMDASSRHYSKTTTLDRNLNFVVEDESKTYAVVRTSIGAGVGIAVAVVMLIRFSRKEE